MDSRRKAEVEITVKRNCHQRQEISAVFVRLMLFKAILHTICMAACCAHHISEGLRGRLPFSTGEASLVLEHLVHEFSVSSVCLC